MKLSILHVGVGNVGRELVRQVLRKKNYLLDLYGVELVYCGLFTSSKGLFREQGLKEKEVDDFFEGEFLRSFSIEDCMLLLPHPFVMIDTTASDSTFGVLVSALSKGGYVVMSNKKPLSDAFEKFEELCNVGGNRLFFETTVGAGLPVIHTLQTLLDTGDEIVRIQGCFSGTLGYIFSQMDQGILFSEAVKEAKKLGFTEPDPRDDLSGMDVARKALILSRLIGKKIDMKEIRLEKLYSDDMSQLSVEAFMESLPLMDEVYKKRSEYARQNGKVLRFVSEITKASCSVGLRAVVKGSDIGGLLGPDNLIVFQTKRYFDNPLVIKGPGAGVPVTAAGVFGDVVEIVKRHCEEE